MMDLEIKFVKTTAPKQKPADEAHLGFGKIFTDHMFIVEYTVGTGWHDARIVPYGPAQLRAARVCACPRSTRNSRSGP